MSKYLDIILALDNKDLPLTESLNGLHKYQSELKTIFQTNYIELKEKLAKKYFFKLYILNNKQWEFFDYGWLTIFKTNTGSSAYFHTNKSKLLIFSVNNAETNITHRQDSLKHAIVLANGGSYLLFNPYYEVLEMMFSKINNSKIF